MDTKDAIKGLEDKAGIKNNYVVMSKFSPVPFAEDILKDHKFIYDRYKVLWRYDNLEGIWKTDSDQFIRTILRNSLFGDEQQKKNYVDEVVSYIRDKSYDSEFEPDKNPFFIALKNKIYDLKTGEYLNFDSKYFITSKIPHEVNDEHKSCPIIDKFFEDCIGKEHKEILYDIASYMMFRSYPYQKLFFLVGPGGTGKSQYLKLLEVLVGKSNFSSVEPMDIQRDKHSLAQMWLKLANIVSDINYNALDNINLMKKLSGGDTVQIRNMYQNPFPATLYAKQIFSTNKLPVVKEKTRAFYRRIYPVGFDNIVSDEKDDKFILDKMIEKKEMEGFIAKCLNNLREMYLNNFVFTWDIDIDKVAVVYEELSNPIMAFMNESCQFENGDYCFKWEFIERFNVWLKNNHLPPVAKSEIDSYLKSKYVEIRRHTDDKKGYYYAWNGFKWKNSTDFTHKYTTYTKYTSQIKRVYRYRRSFETGGISGICGISDIEVKK